jgi:hypothetical protein
MPFATLTLKSVPVGGDDAHRGGAMVVGELVTSFYAGILVAHECDLVSVRGPLRIDIVVISDGNLARPAHGARRCRGREIQRQRGAVQAVT